MQSKSSVGRRPRRVARFAAALITVAALLPLPTSADGDTDSATLSLAGTRAVTCSIEAVGTGLFDRLPLAQAATDLKVGEVTEACNAPGGYTISIRSANAATKNGTGSRGVLLAAHHTTGPNLQSHRHVLYQVRYAGADVSFVNGVAENVRVVNAAQNETVNVRISYDHNPQLQQSTYSDVLTFTIQVQQ